MMIWGWRVSGYPRLGCIHIAMERIGIDILYPDQHARGYVLYLSIYVCFFSCLSFCLCIYVLIYVCTHLFIVYVYMYIYIYTYIYIYIYIHVSNTVQLYVYIYIYIHIHNFAIGKSPNRKKYSFRKHQITWFCHCQSGSNSSCCWYMLQQLFIRYYIP